MPDRDLAINTMSSPSVSHTTEYYLMLYLYGWYERIQKKRPSSLHVDWHLKLSMFWHVMAPYRFVTSHRIIGFPLILPFKPLKLALESVLRLWLQCSTLTTSFKAKYAYFRNLLKTWTHNEENVNLVIWKQWREWQDYSMGMDMRKCGATPLEEEDDL